VLEELIKQRDFNFLLYQKQAFSLTPKEPSKPENRQTLQNLYLYCVQKVRKRGEHENANAIVRALWSEYLPKKKDKTLPQIIRNDGFLRMYAVGAVVTVDFTRALLKVFEYGTLPDVSEVKPISFGECSNWQDYFDVDATPPGFLAKFFKTFRLRADAKMLQQVRQDLRLASGIADPIKRARVACALLSFAAAYREIDQQIMQVPHFEKEGTLVSFACNQHLLAEGVKTISLTPLEEHPPIYLCQGTELWPSQPMMLGSILANLGEHGSATDVYAHSWRRIHKQLRDLYEQTGQLPIVTGHSMGGALAMQVALYSHSLIDHAYAFNPPLPGPRDEQFYQTLSPAIQSQLSIFANLDDMAFWRIGEKLFGNVTIFMAKERWRYFPVKLIDALLFIPAVVKLIANIIYALPAHQRVVDLCENYLFFTLSSAEIALENRERRERFDYLRFLPRLYDPLRLSINFFRKIFKSNLQEELLSNEIEIIALHERDLIDTMTESNKKETFKQLEALKQQKRTLQDKLSFKN